MKYLLDTHVVLWFAEHSDKLSDRAYRALADVEADVFVSIASAWEVAIKLSTGKLDLEGGLPEFFEIVDSNGFVMLSVEREYLLQMRNLPEHHKDPFDRMLIATAIVEDMTLITIDENIHKYNLSLFMVDWLSQAEQEDKELLKSICEEDGEIAMAVVCVSPYEILT